MHTQNPRSAGSEEAAMRQIALAFDIKRLNASFLDNPFPVYRALREHDPVHRMPDGSYFLSRYEDCAAVYCDPETWSSDKRSTFGRASAKARFTSTTPPALCSTIRHITAESASSWRRRLPRER